MKVSTTPHSLSRILSWTQRWSGIWIGLLAFSLVLTGCDSGGGNGGGDSLDGPSVADRVSEQSELSTLAAALDASGQTSALNNASLTFTVFAPSNSAFDLYEVDTLTANPSLLKSVLQYHRVTGSAVASDSLEDGDTFTTAQGGTIGISNVDGNSFVEGAQITGPDAIEAENGIAHTIDDVLLNNRSVKARLWVTSATQALYDAAVAAEIDTLSAEGVLFGSSTTVFAPNNSALENTDLSSFSPEEVQQVLRYHALDGAVDSGSLVELLESSGGQTSLATLQGEDVMIAQQGDGTIEFNGGQATLNLERVDQRASNGIIHLIEGVLVPPSLSNN